MPKGTAMTVAFELEKQQFVALNGGPVFKFSQAMSFVVNCKTQQEVDYFWERLSEGGETQQCGWLKDRYGVSWQVIPTVAIEMLRGRDRKRSEKVMSAILQMEKIDIKKIKQALEG